MRDVRAAYVGSGVIRDTPNPRWASVLFRKQFQPSRACPVLRRGSRERAANRATVYAPNRREIRGEWARGLVAGQPFVYERTQWNATLERIHHAL